MIRLGIIGSTRGTNLPVIADAIAQQKISASIEIVISNKQDAGILQKAQSYSMPHHYLSPNNMAREEYDAALTQILKSHQVNLIVLIGYMRILSPSFVSVWENKVINVHPSLLPLFSGMIDMQIHRAVIAENHHQSGCTVHYVTEEVDAGPILLQKTCAVISGDVPETLKQRVQSLEGAALVEAIALHAKKKMIVL